MPGLLDEETWIEVNERYDREELAREVDRFLDGSACVARLIRTLCGEKDYVQASDVIGFIAGGGLERDAEAAKIAQSEYQRFLLSMPPIPAAEVVESMVHFYTGLGTVFSARGVKV